MTNIFLDNRIRHLREELGLTPEEMVRGIHNHSGKLISQDDYLACEHDDEAHEKPIWLLGAIAWVFGMSLVELLAMTPYASGSGPLTVDQGWDDAFDSLAQSLYDSMWRIKSLRTNVLTMRDVEAKRRRQVAMMRKPLDEVGREEGA